MSERLPHFVSTAPFDTSEAEKLTPEQERYYLASQWMMMWWRFKRHKIAVVAGVILLASYMSIIVVEFLAPYGLQTRHNKFIYAPPQMVRLFDEGAFVGPFVYGLRFQLNMETLQREYVTDRSDVQPLRFFCLGDPYEFWGLFPGSLHLVCPAEGGTLFLLGTDRLGRDMASRLLYGGRISLTVGLVGITISFLLGITIGGIAGYFGGWVDNVIQRLIEILRSLPELPLWMALSAALPVTWSPILIYLGITVILGLARLAGSGARRALEAVVAARGRFLRRGAADGCPPAPDHRPPPAAEFHEPPDRLGDALHPVDDPRRNRAQLSRPWAQAAGDKLGRIADRSAEYRGGGALSVASHANVSGGGHGARLQFPRRRHARRRRPLRIDGTRRPGSRDNSSRRNAHHGEMIAGDANLNVAGG